LTRQFFVTVKILTRMKVSWSAEDSEPARVAGRVIALAQIDAASPTKADDVISLEEFLPVGTAAALDIGTRALEVLRTLKQVMVCNSLSREMLVTSGRRAADLYALGGEHEIDDIVLPGLTDQWRPPLGFTNWRTDLHLSTVHFTFGGSHSISGPQFTTFEYASFYLHISGRALWISAPPTEHNVVAMARFYNPNVNPAPRCAGLFLEEAESVQYRCMRDQEAVFFPPATILIIVANTPAIHAVWSVMRNRDVEHCIKAFSALTKLEGNMSHMLYLTVAENIRHAACALHEVASGSADDQDEDNRLARSRDTLNALARFETLG
jgi:hypothetical protein